MRLYKIITNIKTENNILLEDKVLHIIIHENYIGTRKILRSNLLLALKNHNKIAKTYFRN